MYIYKENIHTHVCIYIQIYVRDTNVDVCLLAVSLIRKMVTLEP